MTCLGCAALRGASSAGLLGRSILMSGWLAAWRGMPLRLLVAGCWLAGLVPSPAAPFVGLSRAPF